jgi:ZIP family zinc transporter
MTLTALAWGAAVGGSLLLGTLLAAWREVPEQLAAAVTAFAGGALIAAVGLEIVPEADEHAGSVLTAVGLGVGALAFVAADWVLTREERAREFRRSMHAAAAGRLKPSRQGEAQRGYSIALGIFIDGVPETAALGITIAERNIGLALLAGIVISNLTEAYGASVFIIQGGRTRLVALAIFAGIAAALVVALVFGATLLTSAGDSLIGFASAIAGGAVLATVSISIIPHAYLEVSRFAAVAGVLGFVVGYLLT